MRSIAVALVLVGCAHARSPDAYRADVEATLATKRGDIKTCYDKVLAQTPTAAGRVSVKFAVEPKTGKLVDPTLDPARTTAPDPVSQCVLAAIPALAITPADAKRGEATWEWQFALPER